MEMAKKMIKMPHVPKNELELDYLTEGSAGSAEASPGTKKGARRMNFDAPPGKVMNKTLNKVAFDKTNRDHDKSPELKPFTNKDSAEPPSQNIVAFTRGLSKDSVTGYKKTS